MEGRGVAIEEILGSSRKDFHLVLIALSGV